MLILTSSAFEENGTIPPRYTCDGEGVQPPLAVADIPAGTVSLALLCDDPDIPQFVRERMGIDTYDHWTIFNIPVSGTECTIEEGVVPEGAVVGQNSGGENNYHGPCPPDGEHRYVFKLFALDRMLELNEDATKADVLAAIEGHVLEATTLIGRYARLPR